MRRFLVIVGLAMAVSALIVRPAYTGGDNASPGPDFDVTAQYLGGDQPAIVLGRSPGGDWQLAEPVDSIVVTPSTGQVTFAAASTVAIAQVLIYEGDTIQTLVVSQRPGNLVTVPLPASFTAVAANGFWVNTAGRATRPVGWPWPALVVIVGWLYSSYAMMPLYRHLRARLGAGQTTNAPVD
jgi:hypothetical protein